MSKYAYFEGKIVPMEEAKVSVGTQALNYGTSCFGGIRGYWNEEQEQLYIFRIRDHYQRFINSTRILMMDDLHFTVDDYVNITVELMRKEGYREDVYIRPLAYKSAAKIACHLHGISDEVTIYSEPFGPYIKLGGVDVTFSSWRRVDDNAIPARGKLGGAYVNSALIKSTAVQGGFDEALVLTQEGHVAEGSAMNFFMIRNGVAITPPITENILEGITRRTVITLMKEELGMEVVERVIDRSEVLIADELLFCGTGAQVASITKVDHRIVGDGKEGEVVIKLSKLFFDIVRGKNEKYASWCTPVFEK